VNESDSEIVGADVENRDIDGRLVGRRDTDSRGYARWLVAEEYEQHDENGDHDGDDTGETRLFTPHNVSARKYGLVGYAIPEPHMNISKVIMITLNTTSLPDPPTLEGAELLGPNLTDVLISWDLSRDDGSGLDNVDHYAIYYSSEYETYGRDYMLLGKAPSGTDQYVHKDAGKGDAEDYFYYVQANSTFTGGLWQRQVAKFTRPLLEGPNLVSIPLIQSSESIETVLQTVQYDKAWFYDPSTGEWKWFMKHKGYRRGLFNINHTMGLWINVTQDSNLTVAGVVPAQTRMHLYEGWNLISFPSFNSSYTVNDLKMNTGAMRVEGYDSAPPYHLRVLSDVDVLQAGYGYWVRVPSSIDWVIEVS